MSKGLFIFRIVTGLLFIGAGVLFFILAEGNRTMELIALVFLLVGFSSIGLVFVLQRIFDRLNKG